MIKEIRVNGKLVAIILRSGYKDEGVKFFSDPSFSQQFAYMNHKKGHIIPKHIHNKVKREVFYTQEVLFIKSGKLWCELYDDNKRLCCEAQILKEGDFIFLVSGGHGFECLEDTEIIEIKQGPYTGEQDKTRF